MLSIKKSNIFTRAGSSGFAVICGSFLLVLVALVTIITADNSNALECADGVTSSGGICGTDTADVHVSVEGGWAISVSSVGTLGVDVSPTKSGTLSTVVDNVNVYTNIPTGYQLYLNSTSGSTDIYNASDTEQSQNHFVETSGTKATPAELAGDTWGYSLDATPTTFAKVALTNDDADSNIYTANTKTPSEGDDIPVTYGFMADTKLQPGTYSTSVTYTAIADAPSYTITSVSPDMLLQNDQTDKTITIMTSAPTSELAFGNISAKIGDIALTDCSEITDNGYRGVSCTYSGSLTSGTYTVSLASTWHNAAYVLENGFRIGDNRTMSDITYMQEMNSDICANSTIDTAYTLKDSRDQKSYRIRKHKDNNCWMNQNLALDGNRTLTPADSNVAEDRKLNANISSGAMSAERDFTYSGIASSYTTSCGSYKYCVVSTEKYGNMYNLIAATAGTGATSSAGTIKESICPSASNGETWRLPDGGADTELKSYSNLVSAYGLSPTGGSGSAYGASVQTMQKSPLLFALNGYYADSKHYQGMLATYLSRSVLPDNTEQFYMLRLNARDGNFFPIGNINKGVGGAVRCVLGE